MTLSPLASSPLQSHAAAMREPSRIFPLLFLLSFGVAQEVDILSELPFSELLARKKILGNASEPGPVALALKTTPEMEVFPGGPRRKAFHEYEDYGEEIKGQLHKKKSEHKIHDILNTSIMTLSYLAFGGYLLCMIANAVREKRRRLAMAYPSINAGSNQLSHVLHHYMSQRPARPFTKFPAVSLHHGKKKRRKR